MNNNFSDVLCDQVIDVALVIKEIEETPFNISPNAQENFDKFFNRLNSVLNFLRQLYVDYTNDDVDEEFVNDRMIELMHAVVKYKNSYKHKGIAYKTMNSILDILKDSFIMLNN